MAERFKKQEIVLRAIVYEVPPWWDWVNIEDIIQMSIFRLEYEQVRIALRDLHRRRLILKYYYVDDNGRKRLLVKSDERNAYKIRKVLKKHQTKLEEMWKWQPKIVSRTRI